jgi:hypothetical protein
MPLTTSLYGARIPSANSILFVTLILAFLADCDYGFRISTGGKGRAGFIEQSLYDNNDGIKKNDESPLTLLLLKRRIPASSWKLEKKVSVYASCLVNLSEIWVK